VFLNEERNELGEQAFQAALEYVKKNEDLGIEIGEILTAVGNSTDAQSFLQSGKYNSISTQHVAC
jgi:thioredoxin-like negative regulator of GroEL